MLLPISCVRQFHGAPTLFLNGEPFVSLAYITYVDSRACYRSFAQSGYKLFSCSICFGDRPINALNRATAMRHGIFERKGEAHFEYFDEAVRRILSAVPDALIFPRLNVSPPAWWEEEHPDECNDRGFRDGPRRFCVSSRKWLSDTKDFLRKFFAHVAGTRYQEHLVGWQIAGGNTEEWLPLDFNGGQGPASRRFFAECSRQDQSPEAYHRFLSEVNAEAVMELAKEVKELTLRRLVVGTFYGYLLETPFWFSMHHALSKLLRCPDVDFLCSPASYSARLKSELGWPTMTAVDSIRHHGKLYLFEFDTRTHLTGFFHDALPQACPADAYTEPIWRPLHDQAATLNALRMNFAQQMALGMGGWWFDMWGGWYESPALMAELKAYLIQAKIFMSDEDRSGIAECAAFVDERSYAFAVRGDHCFAAPHHARMALLHSGVPCDFYELADFPEVAPRYRAFFFIEPIMTEGLRKAMAWCDARRLPWMPFREGECTSDERPVRQFCLAHGLHCYNLDGHAMYISRNLVSLHARTSGYQTIQLPEVRKVTPLFPSGESFVSNQIALSLAVGETAVFRLDAAN